MQFKIWNNLGNNSSCQLWWSSASRYHRTFGSERLRLSGRADWQFPDQASSNGLSTVLPFCRACASLEQHGCQMSQILPHPHKDRSSPGNNLERIYPLILDGKKKSRLSKCPCTSKHPLFLQSVPTHMWKTTDAVDGLKKKKKFQLDLVTLLL